MMFCVDSSSTDSSNTVKEDSMREKTKQSNEPKKTIKYGIC